MAWTGSWKINPDHIGGPAGKEYRVRAYTTVANTAADRIYAQISAFTFTASNVEHSLTAVSTTEKKIIIDAYGSVVATVRAALTADIKSMEDAYDAADTAVTTDEGATPADLTTKNITGTVETP